MQESLGRPLKTEEHVHHIDEDVYNNNIENLELLTRSEHLKKHFKTNKAFHKHTYQTQPETREKIRATLNGVVGAMSKEDIAEMYVNQCMSLQNIGDKYGVTHETVRKSLVKYNIPRRNAWDHMMKEKV